MLLPLKDINPTTRPPVVTVALLAANVLVYIWQLTQGLQRSFFTHGFIPARLLGDPDLIVNLPAYGPTPIESIPLATLLTAMFMHGGWLHLGGNMLYLWIFGNNVEDRLGHFRFLAFYLVGGIAATLAHYATGPGSTLPMVGASGAVAAVLGAYFRLYPKARVRCLLFIVIFFTFIELPAFIVLGWWIVLQVVGGLLGLGGGTGGGVAWFAHIGGFFAGIGLLALMGVKRRVRASYN